MVSLIRVRILTLVVIAMFAAVAVNMLALQGRSVTSSVASVTPSSLLAETGEARDVAGGDGAVMQPPEPHLASETAAKSESGLVHAVQRELAQQGYRPGPADGVAGMTTRAAVFAYQYDHGLPLTADPTEDLLEALVLGLPRVEGGSGGPLGAHAERLVRTVQGSLKALGFGVGQVDGHLGPMTQTAIKAFEAQSGLTPNGRISADLIRALGQTRISTQSAARG